MQLENPMSADRLPVVSFRVLDQGFTSAEVRVRLMAGDCFGRRYYCNHSHRSQSLEITIASSADPTCYQHRLHHPLCCNQPWAVATLRLAVRQKLKRMLRYRQDFAKAWREIDAQLAGYFDLPDIDAYWELAEERRFDREQVRAEKKAQRRRTKDTRDFIHGSARPAKGRIQGCFIVLGLKCRPKSMEQLKRAYRAAATATHPDAGGSAAEFRAVQEAFEEAKRVMRR